MVPSCSNRSGMAARAYRPKGEKADCYCGVVRPVSRVRQHRINDLHMHSVGQRTTMQTSRTRGYVTLVRVEGVRCS